ncbi:hypothetical protein [Amycolatopsis circi]|uniref:hypothetical protein n=1 Tax=Amycolatopsis circi TaxID=871959 RepID=UPI001FC9890D|nr:hypothetical protein [Amycolatopsis circi]
MSLTEPIGPEHRQRGEHAAEAKPRLPVGVSALGFRERVREIERCGVAIPNRADVLQLDGSMLGEQRPSPASVAPDAGIPGTERRARFLVDVALCFAQWNKPDRAYRTLLAAERTAPGEVRTRATVRHLVSDLLQHPGQASLPGLRQLAARTHARA